MEGVYRRDPKAGAFLLEISLDKYRDVFNDWDSANFQNRDMDPELKNFLESCSADIPMRYPLIFQFTLPKHKQSSQKEQEFTRALRNNFNFNIYFLNRQIRQGNKSALVYTIIAFFFLALGLFLNKTLHEGVLGSIFSEGFVVGGWVFLWEAFSSIFFRNAEIRRKKKEYIRFYQGEIVFIYKDFHSAGQA